MVCLRSTLVLALCAISASAAPSAGQLLDKRQGTTALDTVTCGSNSYSRTQIEAATAEGCRLNAAGQTLGNNRYPHTFNNREKLVFAAGGPFQEFPILSNGQNFTGRSPGPDRVVFNPNIGGKCTYVGSMTHTGASGNGFLLCTTKQSRSQTQSDKSAASSLGGTLGKGTAATVLSMLINARL
ncbi:guanyl-specific ribonuclease F1 [Gaeumannomyces tritici R3-111a-1]|uniref:ribonuclease T1 n=1 Tax=Gaeumannomyces tritici (strain R3-111a-1) TaxID=644352 RepID=J3NPL7_GAET3|nr:guanyl-specific ribonuclease F1 [Gaeumannomyces tritici R3-111a-1]EJT78122.1 guanyl-specific ribonuclease F1 [Gaeumannomyces tritici R3-111a-1]